MSNRKLNVLPCMERFAEEMDAMSALMGPGKPKGYAATPGTGPTDETCKSCKHYAQSKWTKYKSFRKCLLMRARWNNSYGTDIKASAPACKLWEKP